MTNSYFIITGTSRGIGEALAATLLDDAHYVCGISRGKSEVLTTYDNYFHINFDLSQIERINRLMVDLLEWIKVDQTEMICLINNAAILEPLSAIEHCQSNDISKNLHLSLIAPIVLTSSFINQTGKFNIRKKIINISSGSGVFPAPEMSVYCTAKAGLNMFTRCIGVEQKNRENPIEILAIDPGMVETEMQRTARGLETEEFAMASYFKEAYSSGQLQSTKELAKHLKIIIHKEYESGRIMNYLED